MLRGYHSLPKAGTAYTPQWMKMPNLASRYHSGTVYFSSDSHEAWNGPRETTCSMLFMAFSLSLLPASAAPRAPVPVKALACQRLIPRGDPLSLTLASGGRVSSCLLAPVRQGLLPWLLSTTFFQKRPGQRFHWSQRRRRGSTGEGSLTYDHGRSGIPGGF